jgi:NAD+ synthase (glutamine-hydrolysing)
MKICLGQINTTPGDFEGNLASIKRGIDHADSQGCDVVVFPELSIPGYLSQDLVYNPAYIDRNLSVLDELVAYSKTCTASLHIVVGYIDRNEGVGKPFFNRAAVIAGGAIVASYSKQLLPFYDVFDELRYYEPGADLAILEIAGQSVGIAICEDLWNDKGSDGYRYEGNPMSQYQARGVDVILSLNSSPYVHDKTWQRLSTISPGPDISVVYVNQCGGQDELVFDGQSFVLRDGGLLHLSRCAECFDIVDLNTATAIVKDVANNRAAVVPSMVKLFDLLVLCLRDYVKKSGFSQVVLASSGGVDSAVVCKIACEAVGAHNVHAIRMPSVYSSDHSRSDAIQLHQNLGCWDYVVPVEHESVVAMLNKRFLASDSVDNPVRIAMKEGRYAPVADENIQARLRDLYVMHFSNAFGAMPLSTGNKTESACGYYTHFDMNFSFAPIKDLYKYQVVDLAEAATDIPANIWRKPPSAELAEDQTDESSLLPYAVLDPIVRAYVEAYQSTFHGFCQWVDSLPAHETISGDPDRFRAWLGLPEAASEFERILSLIGKMEYKRRQTCPGTKVSPVAFGIGRRIPIVEKWS